MKKLVFIILILVLFSGVSYASSKPIAEALETWLRAQNKFDGAKVRTSLDANGEYIITAWDVPGVAKPTEQEIQQIVSQADQDKASEKTSRKNRKKAVLQKMGLTKNDLKALIEMIEDKSDE